MKKTRIILPILVSMLISACAFGGRKFSSEETSSSSEFSTSEQTSSTSQTTSGSTNSSSQTTSSSSTSSSSSSSQTSLQSIELNESSIELNTLQTFQLTPIFYPENDPDLFPVKWTSYDSSVASVDDNGLVTATGEGSTYVRVQYTKNSKIYAECSVTVKDFITVEGSITVDSIYDKDTSWSTLSISDFIADTIALKSVSKSNVYGTGEKAIRLGAARAAGSLTFNFDATVIFGVRLYGYPYATSETNPSVTVTTSANKKGQTLVAKEEGYLEFYGFSSDVNPSTSLTISTVAKNFYALKSVELIMSVDEAIYPQNIYLNADTNEVSAGKTLQLTVSYLPSNTNQKRVTFESNNESVLTVSDKGLVTGVSEGNATVTAIAYDHNLAVIDLATIDIHVTASSLDAWTIMIYMCGSNLESGWDSEYQQYYDSYLASSDLDEIKSVKNQPDDVNIIVEAGGAKRWKSTYSSLISTSKLNRFHLENGSYVKDEQITKANMGLASTFQSFLEWGLTEYPAQKTAVILWNHGGGLQGVCYDELYGDDSLLDSEVLSAVKGAFKKTSTSKLEWVGYDACLMQLQDVAEFNSPYFNYMVGSQESESGTGWDYASWVDDLYSGKDTETILTAIVDGFIADNGGVNATGYNYEGEYYPADQTLSFLNLNYMDEYKEAWENMASALKGKITSSNKSSFNKIIGATKPFAGGDYFYFCEFDAYHFITLLGKNSTFNPGSSYIDAVKEAFNNLVVYNSSQKEGAHDAYGLSFYYVANNSYGQKSLASSTYSNFTNWNYISTTYGGNVTSTYQY